MAVHSVLRGILAFCACFISGFIMFSLFTLTTEKHTPTFTLTASINYNKEGVVVRLLNSEAMKESQANCSLEYCREKLPSHDTEDFIACSKKANIVSEAKDADSCLFLSPKNRPLVALASFPGSGNTWVRGLLQKVTRVCTGATYCDISLRVQGFPGEGISSPSTLVVKTHNPYPHWTKKGATPADNKNKEHWSSAILLVRNPFDALVSEWNRRQANLGFVETKVKTSHTDSVGPEYFGTNKEWDKFVHDKAELWLAMLKQYLVTNWHHPVLVVSYELLRNDTSRELRRMLDFLQVTYDQAALEHTVDSDFKTFHRGKAQFAHFTKSQAQLVRSLIAEAKNMLAENRRYFLQFLLLDDYLHTTGVTI
eukprot:Em0009g101a